MAIEALRVSGPEHRRLDQASTEVADIGRVEDETDVLFEADRQAWVGGGLVELPGAEIAVVILVRAHPVRADVEDGVRFAKRVEPIEIPKAVAAQPDMASGESPQRG